MPKNSYLMELRTKKQQLKEQMNKLADKLDAMKHVDDDFMELYRELNEVRISYESVKSRIQHRKSDVIIPSTHPYNGQLPSYN